MTLAQVLQECADRNGVSLEPGTIRDRQVSTWLSEFGELTDTACGFLADALRKLDSWPKYGEIRSAISHAKGRSNAAWATSGEVCTACNGTGWVPFEHSVRGLERMPWAAACLCPRGDHAAAVKADGGLYRRRLESRSEPNHANSTPERRQAALRYIVASFQRDEAPIRMVEAILAGERDDVVRSLGR